MQNQIKFLIAIILVCFMATQTVLAESTTIFLFKTPVSSAEEACRRIEENDGVGIERVLKRQNSYTTSIGVLVGTGTYWTVKDVEAEVLEVVDSRSLYQGLLFTRSVSLDELQQNTMSTAPSESENKGWGKTQNIIVFNEPQASLDSALKTIAGDSSCVEDVEATHIWFIDRYAYSLRNEIHVVKKGEVLSMLFWEIYALQDVNDGKIRAIMTIDPMTAAEFARRFSVDGAVKEDTVEKCPDSVEVAKDLIGLIGENAEEVVSKEPTVKETGCPQNAFTPSVDENVWNVVIDPAADKNALRKQYSDAKEIMNFLKLFWQGSREEERVILRSVASDLKSSATLIKTRYHFLDGALD